MKRIEPLWEGVVFTEEEWVDISGACRKSKWWPIITKIKEDGNEPIDLTLLDREVRAISTENFPTWYRGVPTLNQALRKANLPFRIRKVLISDICGKGMVQLRRE